MSKNTTIYGCFNPRKVVNKYTREKIWTSCGKCDYCRGLRSYELKSRIEREFLNPQNKCCWLVTLDYNNESLPIYARDPLTGNFSSNREGFPVIESKDVPFYARPMRHPVAECFGHLCYYDVLGFFQRVRGNMRYQLGKGKEENEEALKLFKDISYEDASFRYFLCGEYGPTTFRPHYHILLWFRKQWTDSQKEYLSQILSKAWPFGSIDIKACTDDGASGYVSGYVTSSTGLPDVLTIKPIKPFCTFSKMPTIGSYQASYNEIQNILIEGTHRRTKYDEDTKEHVSEKLSPTFFSRFFPKCVGFGSKATYDKLRVYSYVFNYFKDQGITHTLKEAEELSIRSIDYPILVYTEQQRRLIYDDMVMDLKKKQCLALYGNEDIEAHPDIVVSLSMDDIPKCKEWDYRDKYAALVCYRYCIAFGWSPEAILSGIEKVYSRIKSDALGAFYEKQEFHMKQFGNIMLTINHDPEYLSTLPHELVDLTPSQLSVLQSYGISIEDLYVDEVLDLHRLGYLDKNNDPHYHFHCSTISFYARKGIKSKKFNEYKRSIKSNIIVNRHV